MTTVSKNDLIKIILIVVMAIYIGVKDIVAPLVGEITGRKSSNGKTAAFLNAAKIDDLEKAINRISSFDEQRYEALTSLIAGQAQQSEAISNMKASLERLEKRLDYFMNRERGAVK